ncbi:hypothetical protein Poli38472_004522 [Pythium oligandrum]|uniref:Uncharacterized protein n=1 Tax=Pythium oligandrum TaxID=41045 RepID=A0A8K1CB64_PYTOL|nr:hypothetical protein Poli38472_004522 [Pythium oligandrum]|eukprot:TMW59453.1 hypothetical protein Poli38472_004522 [Pythium oligandrum]
MQRNKTLSFYFQTAFPTQPTIAILVTFQPAGNPDTRIDIRPAGETSQLLPRQEEAVPRRPVIEFLADIGLALAVILFIRTIERPSPQEPEPEPPYWLWTMLLTALLVLSIAAVVFWFTYFGGNMIDEAFVVLGVTSIAINAASECSTACHIPSSWIDLISGSASVFKAAAAISAVVIAGNKFQKGSIDTSAKGKNLLEAVSNTTST